MAVVTAVLALGLLAAVSPAVAGIVGGRRDRRRLDLGVSAVGLVAGIAVLVAVVVGGPVRSFGDVVTIDRVGAAWSTFALVAAITVRTFAGRQLSGDPHRARFAVTSGAAASAGITLFWAGNLVSLAVAAVLTSLAATWLVTSHRDGHRVRRSMVRTLLGADLVLALGVVVLIVAVGDTSFAAAGEASGPALHVAAVALVLAALIRCAQPPFHGWLARSLVAPTPASALLHAGLVNAGGVLLIRNAPVLSASVVATVGGLVVATSGIVLGLAVMRRRHEVKTGLVWSTVAQMGFMLVQVLVGLGAAAAAHLIAHGAYKSSLFLASGSTLEHRRAPRLVVGTKVRVGAAVGAAALVIAAVVISGYDVGAHGGASLLLPVFAVATAFGVLAGPGGLVVASLARRIGVLAATGVAATTYLALIAWFEVWLGVVAPVPTAALGLTLAVVAAVALSWVPSRPEAHRWVRWSAQLDAVARRPVLDVALAATRRPVHRPRPGGETPPARAVAAPLVPHVHSFPFGA